MLLFRLFIRHWGDGRGHEKNGGENRKRRQNEKQNVPIFRSENAQKDRAEGHGGENADAEQRVQKAHVP